MLDLASEQLKLIKQLLSHCFKAQELQVFAFGSRVKNTARKYSDLDLAVQAQKQIDKQKLEHFKQLCSESDLPFMVDIIDLNNISDEFYRAIKDELYRI